MADNAEEVHSPKESEGVSNGDPGSAIGSSLVDDNGDPGSPSRSSLVDDIGDILTRLDVDSHRNEDTSEAETASVSEEDISELGVGQPEPVSSSETGTELDDGGGSSALIQSRSSLSPSESSASVSPTDIWRENVNAEDDDNGSTPRSKKTTPTSGHANGVTSTKDDKSPLQKFIRKFSLKKSSKDKKGIGHLSNEDILARVKVKSLPQKFLAKYLGLQPCTGIYGIKHTRGPVESLVQAATKLKKGADLPLVKLTVSPQGMVIKEHAPADPTGHDASAESTLVPIEFISYGVQDVRYPRIFALVIVRELSAKNKVLECHAYIVDSAITCRRLAMSMAMSFQEYAKTLKGQPHTFRVDLRTPSEISKDLSKEESECEA